MSKFRDLLDQLPHTRAKLTILQPRTVGIKSRNPHQHARRDLPEESPGCTRRRAEIEVNWRAVVIKRLLRCLLAIAAIRAMIIDLYDDWISDREVVRIRVDVREWLDVPALTAGGANAIDDGLTGGVGLGVDG